MLLQSGIVLLQSGWCAGWFGASVCLRRPGCGCGRRLLTGSCVICETNPTGCPRSGRAFLYHLSVEHLQVRSSEFPVGHDGLQYLRGCDPHPDNREQGDWPSACGQDRRAQWVHRDLEAGAPEHLTQLEPSSVCHRCACTLQQPSAAQHARPVPTLSWHSADLLGVPVRR